MESEKQEKKPIVQDMCSGIITPEFLEEIKREKAKEQQKPIIIRWIEKHIYHLN